MNQLLDNLMQIDAKIQTIESFINIKMRIESLNTDDPNYIELVKQTDLLVRVLEAFSK